MLAELCTRMDCSRGELALLQRHVVSGSKASRQRRDAEIVPESETSPFRRNTELLGASVSEKFQECRFGDRKGFLEL